MQIYSTNIKRYPPKRVFDNSEFCSFRQNHSRPNSLEYCDLGGKKKNSEFLQIFFGGYLFVFVEYLYNGSIKLKHKTSKIIVQF